jgi:hypothetical protein
VTFRGSGIFFAFKSGRACKTRHYDKRLKKGRVNMDYMLLLNVVFCTLVVILGFRRYSQTGVKAFAFIAIAYILFGFSHFSLLMEWTSLKPILTALRAGGYITLIIGLLL